MKKKILEIVDNITAFISCCFILLSVVVISGIFFNSYLSGKYQTNININVIGEPNIELIIFLIFWVSFLYHYRKSLINMIQKVTKSYYIPKAEKTKMTIGFIILMISCVSIYVLAHMEL